MKIYQLLSRTALLGKNYAYKFMFAAFVGTHIPLIGLIIYLLSVPESNLSKTTCFLLILGLTLLASAVTLSILYALVAPVRLAQQGLSNYLHTKTLPNLPESFNDEAGTLMRNINFTLKNINDAGCGKDEIIKILSHDLGAPATNILALTSLMKEENTPEETATYTKSIETAVNKQLELMDSMMQRWQEHAKNRPA